MLKKTIAPLLIGAVMLFTLPAKAMAQTVAQHKAAVSERSLSVAPLRPESNLRAVFAEEMSSMKTRNLTAADYRRIKKAQDDQQTQQAQKSGWTKGEKIGLAVFIVGMTVLIAVLIKYGVDNPAPFCADDPAAPDCI